MDHEVPFVLMRGGTSKCVVVQAHWLPSDAASRDALLLGLMGSPDPRQLNGLGGATSTTSKVCIVSPSARADADVDYTFAQVSVTAAHVDYRSNCGNCSSAVGPFAIDEGLVAPTEPLTTVRIFNTNTGKRIIAEVPVENGRAATTGSCRIAGVPGTGPEIVLWFEQPGGSLGRGVLPTGRAADPLDVPGVGTVEVTVADAATPVVFVSAASVGVRGDESARALDGDGAFLERIEAIRARAAERLGLTPSWREAAARTPAIPKVAVVAPPTAYVDLYGETVEARDVSVVARIMSMQRTHPAYAVTGAIATAVAATIPGSVVAGVAQGTLADRPVLDVRIGHPSGVIALRVRRDDTGEPSAVALVRTARRIAKGYAYVTVHRDVPAAGGGLAGAPAG